MGILAKRKFTGRRLLLGLLLFTAQGLWGESKPLTELVRRAGHTLWWDPWRNVGLLQAGNYTAALHPGEHFALIAGDRILNLPGLILGPEGPEIDVQDWNVLISSLKPRVSPGPIRRIAAVVIDPGHGGRDPGAESVIKTSQGSKSLREKDITLAVALELSRLMELRMPATKIVLTRKDDSYPTLEERVGQAHQVPLKPDETILFLSIHANASLNTRAKGLEIWYIPQDYDRDVLRQDADQTLRPILNDFQNYEFKVESKKLAEQLLSSLSLAVGEKVPDRGLKENPWFVVRMAKMPAVLVELGFVTNQEEAQLLADPAYLNKLSQGLYTGLKSFIEEYETGEVPAID